MAKFFNFVYKILGFLGFASILAIILNFDVIKIWVQKPGLDIEVVSWRGIRETNSVVNGRPVFDDFELKLNIIPRVRFHWNGFPVNQVKGLVIKKGEWYCAYRVDKDIPFNIKDEPIVVTLKLFFIPVGAEKIDVKLTDMWGHIYTVPIT